MLTGDGPLLDRVPPPLTEGQDHRQLQFVAGRCGVKVLGQGPELHAPQVQVLNYLETIGQPPGEPVNVGHHQSAPLNHQVKQLQQPTTVVLCPTGLLGSNVAQGAAGANQPLHLEVEVLVLRLHHRDPGVTVQRHPVLPPGWNTQSRTFCQA